MSSDSSDTEIFLNSPKIYALSSQSPNSKNSLTSLSPTHSETEGLDTSSTFWDIESEYDSEVELDSSTELITPEVIPQNLDLKEKKPKEKSIPKKQETPKKKPTLALKKQARNQRIKTLNNFIKNYIDTHFKTLPSSTKETLRTLLREALKNETPSTSPSDTQKLTQAINASLYWQGYRIDLFGCLGGKYKINKKLLAQKLAAESTPTLRPPDSHKLTK